MALEGSIIYTEKFTAPPLFYFSILPIRLYTPRLALQTPGFPSRCPAGPPDHQLLSTPLVGPPDPLADLLDPGLNFRLWAVLLDPLASPPDSIASPKTASWPSRAHGLSPDSLCGLLDSKASLPDPLPALFTL